jgi:hypothetical protein
VETTTLIQLLILACALVITVAHICLAYDIRQIRHVAHRFGTRPPKSSQDIGPFMSPSGFAIYVFRNSRWELESDLSAPGCEPSPPTIPGAFEGHVVKKESRPSG